MQEMLRNSRARRAEGDRGFTLIELLVVVVIIGVLVAIAVPVYLNYRRGASDKSAQSDVRGAISAVENFYTVNGNTYPTGPLTEQSGTQFALTGGTGTAQTINLSDGTRLLYEIDAAGGYFICAVNDNGETVYEYSSVAGGSVRATTDAALSNANCGT